MYASSYVDTVSENATKKLVKKRIELDQYFRTHRKKQYECWERLLNELNWDHIAVEKVKKKWQNANKEYSVWRKKQSSTDAASAKSRPGLEYMQLLHDWYKDRRIDPYNSETVQAVNEISESVQSDDTIIEPSGSNKEAANDPNRVTDQETESYLNGRKSVEPRSPFINQSKQLKRKRPELFPTILEEQTKFLNPNTSESAKMLTILNKITDGWMEYLKYIQRRDFGQSRVRNGPNEETVSSTLKARETCVNERVNSDHHYHATYSRLNPLVQKPTSQPPTENPSNQTTSTTTTTTTTTADQNTRVTNASPS